MVTAWSEKYQMSFNLAKCHVLHLGHNNPISEYTMYKCHEIKQTTAGTAYFLQFHTLEKVNEEVDLGVTVDDKLKFSKRVDTKAKQSKQDVRSNQTHI